MWHIGPSQCISTFPCPLLLTAPHPSSSTPPRLFPFPQSFSMLFWVFPISFCLPVCKSFPLSCRESLWVIMGKYGIPEKIIRIVRLFYEDFFQCAVEDQGETGKWFNIMTGVKQGCNMSGFIFLVVMD